MESASWQSAASLASRAHAHQLRRDGVTPYAAHVFRVAFTVRHAFGCGDDAAIAMALLHDTIEDTTVDYDDLLQQFGAVVADGVAALTKNKMLREDLREAEYDARLARADWRARLVKLADTFDNLTETGDPKLAEERERMERMIARCQRALRLAEPDCAAHEESRRGASMVSDLVSKARRMLEGVR